MSHTLLMPEGRYEATPNVVIFGVKFTNRQATVAALTPVQAELFPLLGFTIDGVLPPIPPEAVFTAAELAQIDARLSAGSGVPMYAATTVYAANRIVIAPDGSIVKAKTAFTSGSSYDPTKWTILVATAASDMATFSPLLTPTGTFTWNTDGTIATQTVGGTTTTFAWNTDGTLNTETRDGVTRTYSYNPNGTLAGVA